MIPARHKSLLRYWGSHFKTRRQVGVVVEEFRPLIRQGWECHLVLEREPDDREWLTDLTAQGVRIHLEPRPKRKFSPTTITRTAWLCRKVRPDVFICENIHDSPLLGAAISCVPIRIWIKRAMNNAFERMDPPSMWVRLAPTTRLSCALATRIIAVSSAVREELVGLGIPEKKVWVRPNPRRLGDRSPAMARTAVRSTFGLAETDVVWTSVGHAVPVKGWDMLIRAFHRVALADPRAKLLLVGGISRPAEVETTRCLRSEIERLGLGEVVSFTGQVEDVTSLLKASDGFVMSSRAEGFSNALIEALEAGLPCVATHVGIASDVIRPGVNGFLIDRTDEASLAEVLTELTADDTVRAEYAKNSAVPASIPTLIQYAESLAQDFENLRLDRTRTSHPLSAAEERNAQP